MTEPTTLIRVKSSGATMISFSPAKIQSVNIIYDEEVDCHELIIMCDKIQYSLIEGTFDECHFKLNQLSEQLNIKYIDI